VSFFFLLNKSLIKRIVIPTVTVFSSFFCGLSTCSVLIWLLVWFAFLPCANASQPTTPFPEIKFSVFNQFISSTFNSNISLATVLMVFFTLIENPELLNLHARQKNPQLSSENSIISSAWMRALCRQMKDHLPDNGFVRLFKKNEFTSETWEDDLSKKLDGFAECLGLTPYRNGLFHKKLLPISQKSIQPEYIICPLDMECTKSGCHGRHIFMSTKKSDIPIVTLIRGSSIFKGVSVLTGQCSNCQTLYSAHLQSYKENPQDKINHDRKEVLSNSARYLQIGRNMWADRNFSSAVVKSMYSFHASANTYCDYWNNTFGSSNPANRLKLERRQVWQAFVQESIRTVASTDDVDFETPANLSIDDLTEKAFYELGNGGHMKVSKDHSCSECSKPFKESVTDTTIHPDAAPVKMAVLDGIVMGPTVSFCLQSIYRQ
jgi:CxC5 like cysteine cluster associated with KDZ transposases